jgi:hypothetical protein
LRCGAGLPLSGLCPWRLPSWARRPAHDSGPSCKRNNIIVQITRYPIRIEFDKIRETAERYGVEFGYWGGQGEPIKTMWKRPMDLQGKQTLETSWKYCNEANYCIRLRGDKIYTCGTIACADHLNKFFNVHMEVTDNDYLKLESIKTFDEILDFLCAPKPFCKYCNRKGVTTGLKWEVSHRELKEWF